MNENRDVRQVQAELVAAGYALEVDGVFGSRTRAALADYQARLAAQPLPAKPWWRSAGMRGLFKLGLGLAVLFVPALKDALGQVSPDQLVDMLMNAGDHVAALIEIGAAVLALLGLGQAWKGRKNATQPIDGRAVLPGVALPARRVRAVERLPADGDAGSTSPERRRGVNHFLDS